MRICIDTLPAWINVQVRQSRARYGRDKKNESIGRGKGADMYHRELVPVLKEIPIERIFRKIVGRKMTQAERLCFHLKPATKPLRKAS